MMSRFDLALFGPPGTGKTTTCLNMVDEELQKGADPDRIGFFSFTKKAANEGRDRACSRFNFDITELPYFSTIHSMAYRRMGISTSQVVDSKKLRAFGDWVGLDFTDQYTDNPDGIHMGDTIGDKCKAVDELARAMLLPHHAIVDKFGFDLPAEPLDRFVRGYAQWKKKNDYVDFADMLEKFDEGPSLDLLIIDEAQDMSALQWSVARKLASNAVYSVVAGDDDQAIYSFSGGTPEPLMKCKNKRILNQSYRLPREVWQNCNDLAQRIEGRVDKVWNPRDEQGSVKYATSAEQLPLSEGNWLLLARNRYLLKEYISELKQAGIPFINGKQHSISSKHYTAIIAWQGLLKGRSVSMDGALAVYDQLVVGKGFERGHKSKLVEADFASINLSQLREHFGLLAHDAPWFDVLSRIGEKDASFIRRCLKRGESISCPRVTVSTIHGVKGGECDNVAVLPDMAWRTFDEYERNPNDERRCQYVARSRAKQRLFLLDAVSEQCFNE